MIHSVKVPAILSPPPPRPVLLECYTDPLCQASWAFEQHWQRLRAEFGHLFEWRYCLGGTAVAYPACRAIKCAERQGPQAGELYLRAVREAALLLGHNAARPEVLLTVADRLATQIPTVLDAMVFREEMTANTGAAAFQEDLQRMRHHQISQLPTIVLQRGTGPDSLLVVGNQPYEALLQALAYVAPDLFYVPSLVDGGAG